MATSGNITTNTAFGYVKLEWSLSSQSVQNNQSVISYNLIIYRSSAINSTASKSYSIKFNGITVATGSTTLGGSGTKTIKSGTTTITHMADGSKTFAFSFTQQIDITWSGTWIGTVTGSGSGTLPVIPRATTPTLSATTVDMGTTITITLNRANSNFTHNLSYSFGALSNQTSGIGTFASAGTSTTFTPPLTLANQIPNAISGTLTLKCDTYNGSEYVGTKTVSLIVKVPSTVVPIINSLTLSEMVTSPNIATKFSAFVQHKSKIRAVTTATGANGSTIVSHKVYVRDSSNNTIATYVGADVTLEPIAISGNVNIVVSVTDSRGRAASYSRTVSLLAYESPQISAFSAFRCNANGTANYEGEYLNVSLNFNISTVNDLNDKYYEVLYRTKGETSWSTAIVSGNLYSRNDSFVTSITFSGDNAYELKLQLYDFFDGASVMAEIPTAFTLMDCRSTGKGIAFGKVSEKDCMEIALDVEITGALIQQDRQAATLQNGWANYGGGYESASYWIDDCGVVHLAGLIKSGTTSAETVIFTLPTGYRPQASEKFFCVSANAICVIDVYSSGAVAIKTGANATWLSLSGISFRAGG